MANPPEESQLKALPLCAGFPAVPAAFALLVGIGLHELFIAGTTAAAVAALMCGVIGWSLEKHRWVRSPALVLGFIFFGIFIARLEHFHFLPEDIGHYADDEPRLARVQLKLTEEPQLATGPPGQYPVPPRQVFTADVLAVETLSGLVPATGRLPVVLDQPNPELTAGQTITALGMLQRPRSAMNPGEFDQAKYFRLQRILATLTVSRAGNCVILSRSFSPVQWLRQRVRGWLAEGFTQQQAVNFSVLQALLLGDRDQPLRDVQDDFKQTGCGYQLDVSGLHIAALGFLLLWVCLSLRLRPGWTLLIVTLFVVLYAVVSEPSYSGGRAVILTVLVSLAIRLGRLVDRRQMVALAAIIMLLWHPLDAYTAGFQLSFAVVILFVIVLPRVREWEWQRRDRDEFAAGKKPGPMRRGLRKIRHWMIRSVQYSVLAWAATLPLVLFYYGQLSPWAVLSGIVLMPLVILALVLGAMKVVLTPAFPPLAPWLAVVAGWPPHWIQLLVHQLTRLPGSAVQMGAPPIWVIVAYYPLLLLPIFIPEGFWLQGRRRWGLRLAPLLAVTAVLVLPIFTRTSAVSQPDDLKLTLLCLGAGQCAVVELPHGHAVIFDAGSTTVPDVAHRLIEPFLKADHQLQVDDLFLSHGDYDHISAAAEIARQFHTRVVFTSHHFEKNAVGNVPDQQLLEDLNELQLPPRELAVGDHVDLDGGAVVDCLWPPVAGNLNSNNAGLVLRLRFAGRTILFPADIQDPAFAGLLQHPEQLRADVLVAPHHGSSEQLTADFVAAVRPGIIISSNAARLTSKQRRFNEIAGATPLYRTSTYGAITVTITPTGELSINTVMHPRAGK